MTKEDAQRAAAILQEAAVDLRDVAYTLEDHSESEAHGKPYHYIVAWGLLMMSLGYYVSAQVEKARREDAPDDAIYKAEKKWVCFSAVECDHTRNQVESYISVLTREGT